jgi:hypothetical protein
MEGAVRVFAGEFSQSSLVVPSPDPGSPGWVVTPGGAWCRQMYVAGALTEISENADMIRCRVADPTGAFDVVCGGRNAQLAQILKTIPVPSFVAIQGTAQMYQRNGTSIVSVRPEQVLVIDRASRDQLLLITAEYSLRRLEGMRLAIREAGPGDDRMLRAARHYSLTPARILDLVSMAEGAIQGIRPQEPQSSPMQADVRPVVMDLIQSSGGPRGMAVEEIIETLATQGIRKEDVLAALESLITDDECYQPQKGYVKPL